MGALAGLQLAIRHPEKVNKLVFAGGAYDFEGWQPEFKAGIPQQTVEMMLQTPFAKEYPKLAANPKGFPELARKVIALQNEPMAWETDVRALKLPVLIIGGDADGATLEHYVQMFRLLGGGAMGDMGKVLPASRLAIMPATSHTANITQTDLALNYFLPVHNTQLFVETQALNVFNRHGRVSFNTDVNLLKPFNPFTQTPVEGVNWEKGEDFGKAQNPTSLFTAGDYQLPRTYRLSVGVRF